MEITEQLAIRGHSPAIRFAGGTENIGKFEFPNGDLLLGDVLELFKEGITVTKIFKSVTKLSVPRANSGVTLVNDNQIYIGGLKDGKFHGEGLLYRIHESDNHKQGQFILGIFNGCE